MPFRQEPPTHLSFLLRCFELKLVHPLQLVRFDAQRVGHPTPHVVGKQLGVSLFSIARRIKGKVRYVQVIHGLHHEAENVLDNAGTAKGWIVTVSGGEGHADHHGLDRPTGTKGSGVHVDHDVASSGCALRTESERRPFPRRRLHALDNLLRGTCIFARVAATVAVDKDGLHDLGRPANGGKGAIGFLAHETASIPVGEEQQLGKSSVVDNHGGRARLLPSFLGVHLVRLADPNVAVKKEQYSRKDAYWSEQQPSTKRRVRNGKVTPQRGKVTPKQREEKGKDGADHADWQEEGSSKDRDDFTKETRRVADKGVEGRP